MKIIIIIIGILLVFNLLLGFFLYFNNNTITYQITCGECNTSFALTVEE